MHIKGNWICIICIRKSEHRTYITVDCIIWDQYLAFAWQHVTSIYISWPFTRAVKEYSSEFYLLGLFENDLEEKDLSEAFQIKLLFIYFFHLEFLFGEK